MNQTLIRLVWWNAIYFLMGIGIVGCGGASDPAADKSITQSPQNDRVATFATEPARGVKSTTSVDSSRKESEVSPTSTQSVAIDESQPSQVCKLFLDSLKNGNRLAAENLLTRSALSVTGKAGLVLEPIGSSTSRFEVKEPRFASINNEVAYVDCEVTELEQGKESKFTVTWLLKKTNAKWRISGLLADLDEGKPKKLLSFENPSDVEDIKRRSAESLSPLDSESGTETRQADLSNSQPSDQRK